MCYRLSNPVIISFYGKIIFMNSSSVAYLLVSIKNTFVNIMLDIRDPLCYYSVAGIYMDYVAVHDVL